MHHCCFQVESKVSEEMAKLTGSAKNTNGCPIPATWFTLTSGSSCDVIKQLHDRGDELSTHTSTHKELTNDLPKADIQNEILGGRDYLINECGIPAADVTGFRSPYLTTNPTLRQVLNESSFKYDSSIIFGTEEGLLGNRSWPFTMDYGLAKDNCDGKFQVCDPSESYPGVWQVPLWNLLYNGKPYTMDPGRSPKPSGGVNASAYDVLKTAFDESYTGNRAPVPIFVHVFWFTPERVAETNKFIQYALTKPDTYFVTMQQMLEWMENPVPKAQMPLWLQERCGGTTKVGKPSVAQGPSGPLSWNMESTEFRPAIFGRRLRGVGSLSL